MLISDGALNPADATGASRTKENVMYIGGGLLLLILIILLLVILF